jgi:hypothetical protein
VSTPCPFDPTFREGGVGLIVLNPYYISYGVIPFANGVAMFWGTSDAPPNSMIDSIASPKLKTAKG